MIASTNHIIKSLIVVFVLVTTAPTFAGKIIYVDDDANGANDGSSWIDAYNFLQDALTAANDGDEIRVAQGIYKPDRGVGITLGDRTATFHLINGATLEGGYAGFGEPDPDARDIELYETILSGDLLGNDGPNFANNGDNSYHVVTGSGTDATAVLDGFIITGGNANVHPHTLGGGMYNSSGSPTLRNCTIRENFSLGDGGGIYCFIGLTTVTNCTFTKNSAMRGGGMYNKESSPTLINCTFTGNSARDWYGRGGGMYNNSGNPALINCTFNDNEAEYDGGGICNSESNPTLTNCIFRNNTATLGGMMHNWRSSPILINCTIFGNSAYYNGGGIYNSYNGNPTLANCILYQNNDEDGIVESAQVHDTTYATTIVNYSCIQGWTGNLGGIGNIGIDPLFLDADGADNLIGTDDDNLRLLSGSPCIDAGDNSSVPPSVLTDFDGDPRITNGTVDMGAYEGPTQGFLLNTQSLMIPEDQTATFTVALAMDPLGVVHITVTHVSGDDDISIQSGTSLTFDSSNYSDPQTVTLKAAEDQDYFYGKALIWISAPGFFTAGLTATERDNDVPAVVYVDGMASGANNGLSWADAFTNLQDALSVAAVIHQIDEIHVAQGIYKPDQGSGNTPSDREATFHLINVLAIKGGYAGAGTPDPNVRDIGLYESILSGDLNSDDGTNFANNSENSYHVVTGSDTDATAVLDGFTITRGNSSGHGAGMYNMSSSSTVINCTFTGNKNGGMANVESSPTLKNCSFTFNFASGGGGMYNNNSGAVLTNCTFSENIASAFEGSSGGGMYNYNSNPVLTNCIFTRNVVDVGAPDHGRGDGGGIFNWYSNPTLTNCTFTGNKALCGGAGMSNERSNPTINNCIFTGNLAIGSHGRWGYGGAIFNKSSSYPVINNCTFSGNTASRIGGGMFNSSSHPILTQCIFWDDTPEEISGPTVVTYSNVQGGWPGTGNIDADPWFTSPGYLDTNDTPDNHWDDFWVEGDYYLLPDSSCIDAGDPNYVAEPNETDLDGNPRVMDGDNNGIAVVDMGAYEYRFTISAEARIVPQTINLASKGNWLTCYIWLPDEYDVTDIEPNSIFLEDEIQPVEFSVDEQQQVATARFYRSDAQTIINVGQIELSITGRLTDGTVFVATDAIMVIDKREKRN